MPNCEEAKNKYDEFAGFCRNFKTKLAELKNKNRPKGQMSELMRLKAAIDEQFDYILDSVIAPDRKYPERRALAKKLGAIFVSTPVDGFYSVQISPIDFSFCDQTGTLVTDSDKIPIKRIQRTSDNPDDPGLHLMMDEDDGKYYFQKDNGLIFPEKREERFDNAVEFNDGVALVNKGTQWYYIDIFGRKFSPESLIIPEGENNR